MAPRTRGVDFFDRNTDFYAGHADARPEFAERYGIIERLVQAGLSRAAPNAIAIDIGCGRGHLTCALARTCERTIAVDGSQAMLDSTTKQVAELGLGGVEPRHEMLPLSRGFVEEFSGSVQLIVMSSVIEYIERDLSLLAQCREMLVPGGTLIASFANARSLYWRLEKPLQRTRLYDGRGARYQVHQHSEREVRRYAEGVGFEIEEVEYFSMPLQRYVPTWVTSRPRLLATLFVVRMTRSN